MANIQNQQTPEGRMAWRVSNVSNKVADLDIFDVIGDPWTGVTAADFVKDVRALSGVSRINLHINSPGGYVNDALAIYNCLRQHEAEVVAYVESQAASAASFVAMAADKVVIAKNAKIMIHDAHGMAMGNAKDMRALAEMLDEESNNIAAIYAEKAGGTPEDWRGHMQANEGIGSTYRGQEAIDAGLADELMPMQDRRVAALAEEPTFDLSGLKKGAVLEPPAPKLESLLERYSLKDALTKSGGK